MLQRCGCQVQTWCSDDGQLACFVMRAYATGARGAITLAGSLCVTKALERLTKIGL